MPMRRGLKGFERKRSLAMYVYWYEREIAERGEVHAMTSLASLLTFGVDDVKEDAPRAVDLFSEATSNRCSKAFNNLEVLFFV